jgi:hypothetical protein
MLNNNERHSGIRGSVAKKVLQRLESARGCADTHNRIWQARPIGKRHRTQRARWIIYVGVIDPRVPFFHIDTFIRRLA